MKNQVIKNLTPEMGKEIIKYWQSRGVDTYGYSGERSEEDGFSGIYYGVINGVFSYYELEDVEDANAEVIELPKLPEKVIATDVNGCEFETYLIHEVTIGKAKGKYVVVAEKSINEFENGEEYRLQGASQIRSISELPELPQKVIATDVNFNEFETYLIHEVTIGKPHLKYIVVTPLTIEAFERNEKYYMMTVPKVRPFGEREKKIKEIQEEIEALSAELNELKK